MTELAEIRNMVAEIQKSTAATAEAVSWIKGGIAENTRRLESHMADDALQMGNIAKMVGHIKEKESWSSGVIATLASISAFISAIVTALVEHFYFRGGGT